MLCEEEDKNEGEFHVYYPTLQELLYTQQHAALLPCNPPRSMLCVASNVWDGPQYMDPRVWYEVVGCWCTLETP